MKGLFTKSINNKEKIIVFYMDNKNKVTQRFIRVIKMNENHILAYCYFRKKVRTFNLSSILSAGIAKERIGA